MARKRKMIMEAAFRLFTEKGFAATSTAQLAQEAGVAEGTIFRHFSGKEDIFAELIADLRHEIVRRFEAEMASSAAPASPLEEICRAIRVFLNMIRADGQLYALFFADAPARYIDEGTRVFREITSVYAYITGVLEGVLAEGERDGSLVLACGVRETAGVLTCMIIGVARGVHFGLAAAAPLAAPVGQADGVEVFIEYVRRMLSGRSI